MFRRLCTSLLVWLSNATSTECSWWICGLLWAKSSFVSFGSLENIFLKKKQTKNIFIFFDRNESGPVDRRQGLHHTKMFGFLRALKSIPQGAYSKVAFNVDDMGLGRFVTNSLPIMSENAFRSAFSGKLNKDLETNMEINTILRTRKDLTIRIQYTPSDIHFPPSHHARGMARDAANDAQRQQWIQTTRLHLDEEI